jgi:hypothetical protein
MPAGNPGGMEQKENDIFFLRVLGIPGGNDPALTNYHLTFNSHRRT